MNTEAVALVSSVETVEPTASIRDKVGLWVGKLFLAESRAPRDNLRIMAAVGITALALDAIAYSKGLHMGSVSIQHNFGKLPELSSPNAHGAGVIISGDYSPGAAFSIIQNRVNKKGGIALS